MIVSPGSMFERIRGLLRGALADDSLQATPEQQARPEWLATGDARNPFPFEVIDCRSIALNMMSTTGNPHGAASFIALRRSYMLHIEIVRGMG